MMSEHYAALHSSSQPAAETASFADMPAAKRGRREEERSNLWLAWSFLLRRSTQLADRSNRDYPQREDLYVSLAHHQPWARRTARCLSWALVCWA